MKEIRTIGIVNGGGDAPGLNAVIRAVVRAALNEHRMRVVGVLNGFDGLIWPEGAKEMNEESVSGILPRGGTILGTTNRGNPFAYKSMENGVEVVHDYSSLCIDNARRLGVDAMIVIGGDGTQHIARDFVRKGLNIVGVPKTIDNDLDATETTFGFDTALVIATEAVDRLHTTAESHHRVMLIEVMGRDAGWIALHAGIAGGAHIILVPEIPFSFENVCDAIRARELRGKRFSLIVVAEGVKLPATDPSGKPIPPAGPGNVANTIGYTIREMTQKEVRVTVLGHVQRGGSPTPFDRILGTRFGVAATDLVAKQQFGRMVCLKAGKMDSVSLDEALEKMKYIDPDCEIVHAARAVGATFGDGR
ncbi:MAG TPA: ATP-dependent 6-phosphofructokinase [Methylomirabilota bacterium]|nr:ATP-dependent 6-phosphofructokinase [Methylomirabilota bacterium]